jgi:hypothetical protein
MNSRSPSSGATFLRKHDRNRHNAGADLLTCDAWWVLIFWVWTNSISGRTGGELVHIQLHSIIRVNLQVPYFVSGGVEAGVPANRGSFSVRGIPKITP